MSRDDDSATERFSVGDLTPTSASRSSARSCCGLGFTERIRGSHHIFRREGVRELINLQRDGSQAKPYQVRQVRQVILRNHL